MRKNEKKECCREIEKDIKRKNKKKRENEI